MPITATKKKKDGLTQYRVRVNYTDENGDYKTIERTAYGKAEAQQLEQQIKNDLSKPTSERMTVRELYDEYMETHKHEARETTLVHIRVDIEAQVLPIFGEKHLDELNSRNLGKWKNDINSRDLKVSTMQNYYKHFSQILNFAVKRGYLAKNPLLNVGNFRADPDEIEDEELHYYTAEQYEAFSSELLKLCENSDSIREWGYFVFFSICFYLGTRKGEANALRWTDIDGNFIHIRRSVAQKLKGIANHETKTKTSKSRDLQMPKPLIKILQAHKERCKLMEGFSEDWYICGGRDTLKDSTIENRNRSCARAAGLPHIRIHDFRHTHASLLCNEGINIQEISRRLGHKNVEITWKTYAHLYPREEERAVEILNKIGFKKE